MSRGEKTRNDYQWTEARYRSFIVSALRKTWVRWPVRNKVKGDARVERGKYLCAGCGEIVPSSIKNDAGKRINNVTVDHIEPVVDPEVGFTTWDDYIERMFVERDNLQALCKECHDRKSAEERQRKKK